MVMDESSQSKLTRRASDRKADAPRLGLFHDGDKGIEFLRESEMIGIGGAKRIGNPSSQELTLSYLCDNNSGLAKQAFLEKDFSEKNPPQPTSGSYKGKEVAVLADEKNWVERDFLNLNNSSSKREIEEDDHNKEEQDESNHSRDKRPKLDESLSLSLALPEVSLSLTASNAHQNNANPPPTNNGTIKPSRSVQSLTYNSNDFTAAPSLSYSYSHQFSHNPSCSLTRNSTENFDDQIWNCGEGTNGSVHSRFKPVPGGEGLMGLFSLMQQQQQQQGNSISNKKDSDNSLSFLPSELPARPHRTDNNNSNHNHNNNSSNVLVTHSGDSRAKRVSKPERLLREIVTEPVSVMAQTVQELPGEAIAFAKEYLRSLILGKKDELSNLQARLERRSDLTKEMLSKAHKDQLEIMVAIKMGHLSFLASKTRLPSPELVEIFLFERCRNVSCKSLLPVDDCECKICSGNRGFCNSCMCSVCLNFDGASNTCSWVGCDVCSHWCHASCGTQKNLIRPGPSAKAGANEMQYHCVGCGHASEMFGFVKEVFMNFAKDWPVETLVKELDCVRMIFRGSQNYRGKELHEKADQMISKLGTKSMTPKDAFGSISKFFNYAERMNEFMPAGLSSKESVLTTQTLSLNRKDSAPIAQPLSAKYNPSPFSGVNQRDMLPSDLKPSPLASDDFRFGSLSSKVGSESFESLESIVRIKEAEARMFQTKADEALREAEEYHRVMRVSTEKLEAEYAEKLNRLRLQETEERRRKKLEELKVLENSHCDYYNMKMRMQGEIAGLLERMEATKKQWV